MVTIKEIAEKLNLSPATVSRTLSNDETLSIKPETRYMIVSTATEMGYVSRKKKKRAKKETSILIIHKHTTFRKQIDSSYYYTMRSGVEDICAKSNLSYSFREIDQLDGKKITANGVLLLGNYSREQFQTLLPLLGDLPAVVVGNAIFYKNRFNRVSFSNHDSVATGLAYLFKNGHSRIGYFGIEEQEGTSRLDSRRETFITMMKERNLFRSEWLLEDTHGTDRVEQGYHMAEKLLTQQRLPTAVFCANDSVAIGAINCFTESGVRVPGDISILAHDGSYPTQYAIPPITTVDVHPYQLGTEGTRLLQNRIENPVDYTCEILLTPRLIVRKSVAARPEKQERERQERKTSDTAIS